jgi:regulator of cell morphogenesis and NO signaling
MSDTIAIRPDSTLAELAATWAGASRVFQRHELDFCCRGTQTLAAACRERRIPVAELIAELQAAVTPVEPDADWSQRPQVQLIAHLVDHFHAGHRRELPRLHAMAGKVEQVHAGHPQCPHGLAGALVTTAHDLELHMQKEEHVLFPLLVAGGAQSAWAPIQCLTAEHDEHGRALARLRQLAHGFVAPAEACPTWRALYLGLQEFERAVMGHIHLENHVLFPRAGRA